MRRARVARITVVVLAAVWGALLVVGLVAGVVPGLPAA